MSATRNVKRNAAFIAREAAYSGSREFADHANARLELGDEKFGDRWATLTLPEFLQELAEEGADLGAWAALAAERLDTLELPADITLEMLVTLHAVAHLGARAHQEIERARAILEHWSARTAPPVLDTASGDVA